jgi:hypothetical protein
MFTLLVEIYDVFVEDTSGPFSVSAVASVLLSPGQSTTFTVRFRPTIAGDDANVAVVDTNDPEQEFSKIQRRWHWAVKDEQLFMAARPSLQHTLIMLPLLLFAACTASKESVDSTDSRAQTDSETEIFPYQEGDWTVVTSEPTEPGTCGNLVQLFPQTSIGATEKLTITGTGSFSLTYYVVNGLENCEQSGTTYQCGRFDAEQRWAQELNFQGAFIADTSSAGDFTAADAMRRDTTVNVSCARGECDTIATNINAVLPCTMVITTTFSAS